MAERVCPLCGRGILTRCGRKGLWEKYVLPLFGVFPWRCGRCRTRLRLSDRGADFQRLPARPGYLEDATPETPPGESAVREDGGASDGVSQKQAGEADGAH